MNGPIFNQDDSEFFSTRKPDIVSGEAVDKWVAGLARAGVGTLMSCVCAQVANYASNVWESRWSRYGPDGPDDQPVLEHLPEGGRGGIRRWVETEKALAEMGINFHERAFAACKQHGIGAWASIRMNDLHDCDLPDSPLLSTFYKEQRDSGKARMGYRMWGWPDRALDYEREEVRDHYMKLVREVLGFQGIEGLELDWMRFGYHFRPGRELEGGKVLTEWIRQVRAECVRAAERQGSPVRLGVRVPSTPETARQLGLDGVAWAREGLIDLLVPTPFWATNEFNMPMRTWRRLLDGTDTILAGGLEVRYQPHPAAAASTMSAELATGAAMAVLHGGADFVYLFNYFAGGHGLGAQWGQETYDRTLAAMGDAATLAALPRRHAITYRDVRAPGEPDDHAMPAEGNWLQFRLQTGPKPTDRNVSVLLQIETDNEDALPPVVRVNTVPCEDAEATGKGVFVYPVPAEAVADEVHVIEVAPSQGTSVKVVRVEFAVDC